MPYGTARLGPNGRRASRLALSTARSNLYRAATAAARRMGGNTTTRARLAIVPGITRSSGNYNRFRAPASSGLKPEKKFFDSSLSYTVDTTSELSLIDQIPQGDTESSRDGKSCTVKSIYMRGNLLFDPAAGVERAIVYCWVIQDTQANGALPNVNDIFMTNVANDQSIVMMNMENTQRFKILKKWKLTFNATAGIVGALAPQVKTYEWFKKVNIPIIYSSTTGAITEHKTNSILFCSGCYGSDDVIVHTANIRLRFVG